MRYKLFNKSKNVIFVYNSDSMNIDMFLEIILFGS